MDFSCVYLYGWNLKIWYWGKIMLNVKFYDNINSIINLIKYKIK